MRLALVALALLALPAAARAQQAMGKPTPARQGEVVTELDLDRDGKPDLWKTTRKGDDGKEILVRKERDLNGDGKVDAAEEYGPDGVAVREVFDQDFDGKPDVVIVYEKGQIVRKELSFGFDGKPRAWNYYEKGKLTRRERDLNGDGKVDYWEYWDGNEIDRVAVDLDGDGTVDRWENRRAVAQSTGQTPAAPQTAPPPAKR